jgi:methionyl-tRNA formyltransferase
MKLIYAGTPEFAVPALSALAAAGHTIQAVYTQPDRKAGRGRKLQPSPVKNRALELGLRVEQPKTLRDPAASTTLEHYRADLMVVAAYGLILPAGALRACTLGAINIHASILPRWRGAAPIHAAIIAGDADTGISIMQMDEGLDTGPVLLAETLAIHDEDTTQSLTTRLAALGARLIIDAVHGIENQALEVNPQDNQLASYAGRIHKRDGLIDWELSAEHIERLIRAYNPWPVAHSDLGAERVRIWRARLGPRQGDAVGARSGEIVAVDDDAVSVQTGDGIVQLIELQRPGGRPVNAREFVRNRADLIGQRFSGIHHEG